MRYTIKALPPNTRQCDICEFTLTHYATQLVECIDRSEAAHSSWIKAYCGKCWADEIDAWDQRVAFVDLPPVPRAAPMVTWQAWALQNAQAAGDWHGR